MFLKTLSVQNKLAYALHSSDSRCFGVRRIGPIKEPTKMKHLCQKSLLALLVTSCFAAARLSAATSLSVGLTAGMPGTSTQVAVNYTTDTNAPSLQFDLLYDTKYLASAAPIPGNALSEHQVASSEPSPGVRRVLIFSFSNKPITNGVLVYVPFTIKTNTPDHDEAMMLSNVVVASPQADAVPAETTNGILAVARLPRFISITPVAGGAMHLELVGPPGQRYLIQGAPTAFRPNWSPLGTNVTTSGVLKFDDFGAAGFPCRFYRALVVP
jgi:hypothetical protein